MSLDWSWMNATWTVAGQDFCRVAIAARTPSTVSMTLAPVRFLTSIATAGLPLMRAIVVASLKVGPHLGDIAEGDGRRGRRGDGNGEHVLRLFDERRQLDSEAAGGALESAGRDQAVAEGGGGDPVGEPDAVTAAAASARR